MNTSNNKDRKAKRNNSHRASKYEIICIRAHTSLLPKLPLSPLKRKLCLSARTRPYACSSSASSKKLKFKKGLIRINQN